MTDWRTRVSGGPGGEEGVLLRYMLAWPNPILPAIAQYPAPEPMTGRERLMAVMWAEVWRQLPQPRPDFNLNTWVGDLWGGTWSPFDQLAGVRQELSDWLREYDPTRHVPQPEPLYPRYDPYWGPYTYWLPPDDNWLGT